MLPRVLCVAIAWCAQAVSPASAFSVGFDEPTLQRLAQAASLSYLAADKMASSPYYEACRLEPVAQVIDPESESGATVFRVVEGGDGDGDGQKMQKLVVACRGSANPKNFATNLKINPVPATRLSQNVIPDGALIHEGFQSAAAGLWRELSGPLLEQVSGGGAATTDIVWTGHSLGAATALLCATHYNASFGREGMSNSPTLSVVTFGGPKLCNAVLARHLRNEALGGSDILHLVHSRDPVLANNQILWDGLGWENVGIELECDPHSPIVFGDDVRNRAASKKNASPFGNFAWNIVDHCKYMVCRSAWRSPFGLSFGCITHSFSLMAG